MNKKEIKKAEKLLDDYAERTDTMVSDNGQVLTAYWYGGGQKLFGSIAEIEEWIETNNQLADEIAPDKPVNMGLLDGGFIRGLY